MQRRTSAYSLMRGFRPVGRKVAIWILDLWCFRINDAHPDFATDPIFKHSLGWGPTVHWHGPWWLGQGDWREALA